MAPYLKLWSGVVALALSTSVLAAPNYGTTPPPNTSFLNCATKTVTTTRATCPPFNTKTCATPECILLSTIHLNCDCPTVGLVFTDTVFQPCLTACEGRCGTAYQTIATPCATDPPTITPTPV